MWGDHRVVRNEHIGVIDDPLKSPEPLSVFALTACIGNTVALNIFPYKIGAKTRTRPVSSGWKSRVARS